MARLWTAWRPVSAVLLLLVWTAPATARPVGGIRTQRLQAALAADPGAPQAVWVYLRDKGPDPQQRLAEAQALLWPRARSRRALRGTREALVETADLPLVPDYVAAVAARVGRVRHRSRWLNALSVEATEAQLGAVEQLPFVVRLDRVARFPRRPEGPEEVRTRARAAPEAPREESPHLIDYGPSRAQLEQIGVPTVHDLGLHGQDVVIAVFDTGFDLLEHEAFSALRVVAAHDFVDGDPGVRSGGGDGLGAHGTRVLSVIAGYKTGQLVGPAFAASYILARTEDTRSETPVEEDNWAAAAEWAEALGAEVITTSLGYTIFDDGTGYGPEHLDGQTAVVTRAAQRAAELGVVVLASAGNGGIDFLDEERTTLGAPADAALVIAVGGVDADGARAPFSSVGPTADGRIKPDVMARAVDVVAASASSVSLYVPSNGTSFSCPLAAGVAALVLQAHPDYTPAQVIHALRSTASRAGAPDRLFGWGILDALAAVQAEVPREF